jgi:hypothetical protein
MGFVEPAVRRIVAIALLCHRQRDDPHARFAHRRQQRLRVGWRDDQAAQRSDDVQRLALGAAHRDRIEPVLRLERMARLRGAQARAADRPVRLARREPVIDIDGPMRAMKRADAEMHDADAGGGDVVRRPRDLGGQRGERLQRQPGHFAGSWRARPTICVGLTKRSAIRSQTIDVTI